MKRGVLFLLGVGMLALGMASQAHAQGAAAPPAGAVESRPLPPPGGAPSGTGGSGGVTLTQEPAAPAAPAAPGATSAPGTGARSTLVPDRGDPLDVKEVTLTARAA